MDGIYKISVVVPVYNVSEYLERCLDSIIGQTYSSWEMILVNDGSTDGSSQICQEYASRDNRIIYISQDNMGLSGARNVSGDLVCFVDSDDWLDKDYLLLLSEGFADKTVDICLCGYYNSTDISNIANEIIDSTGKIAKSDFIHKVAVDEFQSFAWNKMFRKDLFEHGSFAVGKYYEDILLLNTLMPYIRNVCVRNECLYHYYYRENSIIHTRNMKREGDYFDALSDRYNKEYILEDDKKHILKNMMISYYYIVQNSDNPIKRKNIYKEVLKGKGRARLMSSFFSMRFIEALRFLAAYTMPILYRNIANFFRK